MRLHVADNTLTAPVLAPVLALVLALVTCAGLTACGSDNNHHGAATLNPSGTVACGGKGELTAEGSTAQQNAVAVLGHVWGQYCPRKSLSYNPTGSGAGREQFIAGHVDFAGSDAPLVADQIAPATKRCNGNPAWDLPLVLGPIALVYNLAGITQLTVNSDALARILTGKIVSWRDPALAGLNPGVALPDLKITPIYRSDSSGTTDNLQKYLTAAAPQSWSKGVGTEFQGGVGEGAAKSSGVIQAVRTMQGAIGYVEKGFADQAGLPYAQIATGAGPVPLTTATVGNAIDTATFAEGGNDLVLNLSSMYGTEPPNAYPLVLTTYEIVCSKGYDPQTAQAIKSFLTVAVNFGQDSLSAAGFVPVTDKVKERLIAAIEAMQ